MDTDDAALSVYTGKIAGALIAAPTAVLAVIPDIDLATVVPAAVAIVEPIFAATDACVADALGAAAVFASRAVVGIPLQIGFTAV